MQPPDLVVYFPHAPAQSALRDLLDAEAARLRRAGVCQFKWIPEEEPDDLDLADIELDEEEEDAALPAPPPPARAVQVKAGTPEEKAAVVARVRALEQTGGYERRLEIYAVVGVEFGRSAHTVKTWTQDADRADGLTKRGAAWTRSQRDRLTPEAALDRERRDKAIRARFMAVVHKYPSKAQAHRAIAAEFGLDETRVYQIVRVRKGRERDAE